MSTHEPEVKRIASGKFSNADRTMIFRLSQKLNAKVKAGKLDTVPQSQDPFADWSCHLFNVSRTQFIIVCNTTTLYSCLMYARGNSNDSRFITNALDMIRDSLEADGYSDVYQQRVAPASAEVQFAKALNRSVTGSINELLIHGKIRLDEDQSPFEVGRYLNTILMSPLGQGKNDYGTPSDAFSQLASSVPK